MKALILAAGRGKRLGDGTSDRNKCLIKIKDRPLIEYSMLNAAASGVKETVIVVGYKAEDIINKYGNKFEGMPIKYVIQDMQKGLVHAIECARRTIAGEDFMLMLGDELMISPRHKDFMAYFKKGHLFGLCGAVLVKDKNLIKRTYSVVQNDKSRIQRLVEKPENPPNNIMGTGNCVFKNNIFDYIPKTPINQQRGEKELPDLIQCAIDDGKKIESFVICDEYINVNIPEEITRAHSYFRHY